MPLVYDGGGIWNEIIKFKSPTSTFQASKSFEKHYLQTLVRGHMPAEVCNLYALLCELYMNMSADKKWYLCGTYSKSLGQGFVNGLNRSIPADSILYQSLSTYEKNIFAIFMAIFWWLFKTWAILVFYAILYPITCCYVTYCIKLKAVHWQKTSYKLSSHFPSLDWLIKRWQKMNDEWIENCEYILRFNLTVVGNMLHQYKTDHNHWQLRIKRYILITFSCHGFHKMSEIFLWKFGPCGHDRGSFVLWSSCSTTSQRCSTGFRHGAFIMLKVVAIGRCVKLGSEGTTATIFKYSNRPWQAMIDWY